MRFARFLTVGVGNTALSLAVFNALVLGLGWPAYLSNAVAYAVGIANSFYWNRRWTWGDRAGEASAGLAARFVAVNLGGLAITTAIVAALDALFAARMNALGLPGAVTYNLFEGVAIVCGLAWNYLVLGAWVFPHRGGSSEDEARGEQL